MTLMTKRLIFLAALAVFAATAIIIWDYSIDDAFITYRYSENLAAGRGLVFNPGDKPIEGYSNFLWLLILSLLYKIGLPTPETAKILGLVFMAGAGGIWYFAYEKSEEKWLWLAGPLFLISPITAFWGLSGLELGLHAVLVAGSVIALLHRSTWVWVLFPLLILSRPEGFIIVFGLLVIAAVVDSLGHRVDVKYLIGCAAAAGVTILALTLFRLAVFGYPLPNTFYAKMHHMAIIGFLELGRMMVLFLPLAIGVAWGVVKCSLKPLENRRLLIFLGLFVMQAFLSSRVDPVMNFLFRYLVAFLPLLIAITLESLSEIPSRAVAIGTLMLVAISLFLPWPRVGEYVEKTREIKAVQWKVIDWLRPQPDSTSVSMTDMGLIPYYTGKKFYDTFGLVNEDIAHIGFIPKKEFLRQPTYFIMVGHKVSEGVQMLFWREQRIAINDIFPKVYQYKMIFSAPGVDPTDSTGYNYLIFARKPDAQKTIKALEETGRL
jgi:arabinofuranosyltransferase